MIKVCNYLSISKSWYYEMKAKAARHKEYEDMILAAVRAIRRVHPCYGVLRLWKQLERDNIIIGRDRLYKLLKRHNLLLSKRFKAVRTSFPGTLEGNFENKVKNLEIDHINQVWCTDITYKDLCKISHREGWILDYAKK